MTEKEIIISNIIHELSERNCFRTLERLAEKQLNSMTEEELRNLMEDKLTFGRTGF